jgi:hypothetical protein
MDTYSSGAEANQQEEGIPGNTCRPPSIVITTAINLIQLQKQLINMAKEHFSVP